MNGTLFGAATRVIGSLAAALCSGGAFGADVIVSQVSHVVAPVSAGEGWVMVDPRDPQQVVVNWLGTSTDITTDPASGLSNPGTGSCGVGWSSDGGRTWTTKKLQWTEVMAAGLQAGVQPSYVAPICGDPVGGVGPDGTIYMAAAQVGSPHWTQGITSSNHGWSWTSPTELFGVNQFVNATVTDQVPTDAGMGRGWMTVDPITGEVSMNTQVDEATFGRMLTASKDHGQTWSTPRPLDPDHQSVAAGPHSAAGGTIAVVYAVNPSSNTYMVSQSPAVKCAAPCTVFETTTNQGVTWTRHVAPFPGGGAGSVAADPSQLGRFAVLRSVAAGLEVWVTADSGSSWTRTWTISALARGGAGASLIKPAIAYSYSKTGALGVVWRTLYADGSYDIDVIVSQDGGVTFAEPVRLTDARSTGKAPSHNLGSDDCACNIHLDENSLSTVWGDATNGRRDLWFGRYYYKQTKQHGVVR